MTRHVAGEFPDAEVETADRGVVQQREGVADDVAEVDGPGIRGAVDWSVVIEHLRQGRGSQYQAENDERSDMRFHRPEPPSWLGRGRVRATYAAARQVGPVSRNRTA